MTEHFNVIVNPNIFSIENLADHKSCNTTLVVYLNTCVFI